MLSSGDQWPVTAVGAQCAYILCDNTQQFGWLAFSAAFRSTTSTSIAATAAAWRYLLLLSMRNFIHWYFAVSSCGDSWFANRRVRLQRRLLYASSSASASDCCVFYCHWWRFSDLSLSPLLILYQSPFVGLSPWNSSTSATSGAQTNCRPELETAVWKQAVENSTARHMVQLLLATAKQKWEEKENRQSLHQGVKSIGKVLRDELRIEKIDDHWVSRASLWLISSGCILLLYFFTIASVSEIVPLY